MFCMVTSAIEIETEIKKEISAAQIELSLNICI